jgi:hypothetical protein
MAFPLTWATLQTALLEATAKTQPPYSTIPPDFAVALPQATNYAEGRIYKEFGGLRATRQQNTSLQTTPNSRVISLTGMSNPNGGPIIVPERFALFGGNLPGRVQFDRASLDMIDLIWPQQTIVLAPNVLDFQLRLWDLVDDHTIVIAPTPDAAYIVEITGLFAPTPIGPGNESPTPLTTTSTYLSQTYPELLVAGCMVWLCGGLLHNFGAASDNPARAMSWEATFRSLMDLAIEEEIRRQGLAPNRPHVRRPTAVGQAPA